MEILTTFIHASGRGAAFMEGINVYTALLYSGQIATEGGEEKTFREIHKIQIIRPRKQKYKWKNRCAVSKLFWVISFHTSHLVLAIQTDVLAFRKITKNGRNWICSLGFSFAQTCSYVDGCSIKITSNRSIMVRSRMPGHVMQLFLFIYYTDESILGNPESEARSLTQRACETGSACWLFVCFVWLCWVFFCCSQAFSSWGKWVAYSLVAVSGPCSGFLFIWLCKSLGTRASSCSTQAG